MPEANTNRALLTDLYELTMAAGYFEHSVDCRATFELFVRELPAERTYLLAAGLDSALGYLENLCFNEEDVRFLRAHQAFRTVSDAFFATSESCVSPAKCERFPRVRLSSGASPSCR